MARRALQAASLVAGGIVVAWVVGEYAEWSDAHSLPPVRWLQAIPFTLLVFGIALFEFRSIWRVARFWVIVIALFSAHVACFYVLLTAVTEWRVTWYVPMSIGETALLISVLYGSFGNLIHEPNGRVRRRL
jgi:hypothetical protein